MKVKPSAHVHFSILSYLNTFRDLDNFLSRKAPKQQNMFQLLRQSEFGELARLSQFGKVDELSDHQILVKVIALLTSLVPLRIGSRSPISPEELEMPKNSIFTALY